MVRSRSTFNMIPFTLPVLIPTISMTIVHPASATIGLGKCTDQVCKRDEREALASFDGFQTERAGK